MKRPVIVFTMALLATAGVAQVPMHWDYPVAPPRIEPPVPQAMGATTLALMRSDGAAPAPSVPQQHVAAVTGASLDRAGVNWSTSNERAVMAQIQVPQPPKVAPSVPNPGTPTVVMAKPTPSGGLPPPPRNGDIPPPKAELPAVATSPEPTTVAPADPVARAVPAGQQSPTARLVGSVRPRLSQTMPPSKPAAPRIAATTRRDTNQAKAVQPAKSTKTGAMKARVSQVRGERVPPVISSLRLKSSARPQALRSQTARFVSLAPPLAIAYAPAARVMPQPQPQPRRAPPPRLQ